MTGDPTTDLLALAAESLGKAYNAMVGALAVRELDPERAGRMLDLALLESSEAVESLREAVR